MHKDDPNQRPATFDERYRLYIDESGDHVFRETVYPAHRFLCLLGCWFKNPDYLIFSEALDQFKSKHLPHHPDDPVVLHREEIINARKAFKNLREPAHRTAFDNGLLNLIGAAQFKVVAVVIDKMALRENFGGAASHPYHLALGFVLQRYAGYLNHVKRVVR